MNEVATNIKGGSESITGDYLRKTFGLHGKVALITGSREGLGEATAIGMACGGAHVVVTSRSGKGLETLVGKINV